MMRFFKKHAFCQFKTVGFSKNQRLSWTSLEVQQKKPLHFFYQKREKRTEGLSKNLWFFEEAIQKPKIFVQKREPKDFESLACSKTFGFWKAVKKRCFLNGEQKNVKFFWKKGEKDSSGFCSAKASFFCRNAAFQKPSVFEQAAAARPASLDGKAKNWKLCFAKLISGFAAYK